MRVWRDGVRTEPDENGLATQFYFKEADTDVTREQGITNLINEISEQLVTEQ